MTIENHISEYDVLCSTLDREAIQTERINRAVLDEDILAVTIHVHTVLFTAMDVAISDDYVRGVRELEDV